MLDHVPAEGEGVTFDAVAASTNAPFCQLKRVCRMLITSGILCEPIPGRLVHSRLSHQLGANPAYLNWARFMTQYTAPTAAGFADASARWGETYETNQTAYNIAFKTKHGFFDDLQHCKNMNAAFTGYMNGLDESRGLALDHVLSGFDWKALGKAHIIDVSGFFLFGVSSSGY